MPGAISNQPWEILQCASAGAENRGLYPGANAGICPTCRKAEGGARMAYPVS
jgi:hypothetical protein